MLCRRRAAPDPSNRDFLARPSTRIPAAAGLSWQTVVSAPDIPGHRVAGVLGTGGFATVYRSWQLAVGREVAVKVDNRVLLSDRDRRRFLREVTAAGRLSGHPHVTSATVTFGVVHISSRSVPVLRLAW